ncbi:MAG: tetratricopeptide repeat protein, partial [Bacteroidia bacterium]
MKSTILLIFLGLLMSVGYCQKFSLNDSLELVEKGKEYHQAGRDATAKNQIPEAINFYKLAIDTRIAVHDSLHIDVAKSLGNLALLMDGVHGFDSGLYYIRPSVAIKEQVPDCSPTSLFIGYQTIIRFLNQGKLTNEAELNIQKAERLLNRFHDHGPGFSARMVTLMRQKGVWYLNQYDYSKAEKSYRKGLQIWESLESDALKVKFRGVINNYGVLLKDFGKYDSAEVILLKFVEISKLSTEIRDVALGYQNLGDIARLKGNYGESIEYLKQAKLLYDNHQLPNKDYYAQINQALGASYYKFRKYDLAIIHFNKAFETWQKIRGSAHNSIEGEMMALGKIGNTILAREKFEVFQQEVQKLDKAERVSKTLIGLANVSSILPELRDSTALASMGSLERELSLLKKSEKEILPTHQIAFLYFRMAFMYSENNMLDSAMNYNRKLLEIAKPKEGNGFTSYYIDGLNQKATLLRKIGNEKNDINILKESHAAFCDFLAGMAKLQIDLEADMTLNFWYEKLENAQVYDEFFRLSQRLYTATGDSQWLEAALIYSDIGKSVSLKKAFSIPSLLQMSNLPPAGLSEFQSLKKQIDLLEKNEVEAEKNGDKQALELVTSKLFETKEALKGVETKLDRDYPAFRQKKESS